MFGDHFSLLLSGDAVLFQEICNCTPTVKQWKHEMPEKLVDGGESVNVNMHIQEKVLKWHIHLWISGLEAVFMSFVTKTQPLKSTSY